MNQNLTGTNVINLALMGRTPCKVTGTVRKGDILVSDGTGSAVVNNDAAVGSIVGKALVDFDGEYGLIEVVVGIR